MPSVKNTSPTYEISIPVGRERTLNNLPFAGASVNKFLVSDVDRSMVDLIACVALEEKKIAFFEIVHRIDPRPAVVVGVRIGISSADLDTAFIQTIMNQSGTVK